MSNKKPNHKRPKPPVNLEVGKRQNVYGKLIYGELLREVTKIEWREIKGELWFFWYWKPEQDLSDCKDCGYSGLKVIDANGKRVKH